MCQDVMRIGFVKREEKFLTACKTKLTTVIEWKNSNETVANQNKKKKQNFIQ